MSVELASIPLAALAGVLGVLSPCVWPLVPVVLSSAGEEAGRHGPLAIAAELALSFAVAGTGVSFLLVASGLDPELARRGVAMLLLGVAIALLLPSVGQDLGLAFLTMLAYGLGTGATLLVAALASRRLLTRLRPGLLLGAGSGKRLLGATLGGLGVLVLTGLDKVLETWAIGWLPTWAGTI